MKRRSFLSSCAIGAVVGTAGCLSTIQKKYRDLDTPWDRTSGLFQSTSHLDKFDTDRDSLQIHTINVAGADSTLIKTPNDKNILVDTGHRIDGGEYVIDYLREHNVNSLDYLVATHAHWDHIGGVPEVIDEYSDTLKYIIETEYPNDTSTYSSYRSAVQSSSTEKNIINGKDSIETESDDLDISIINPQEDTIEGDNLLNDNCIVIHIDYNGDTFLLPSDAEVETEEVLVDEYNELLEYDIFRVGHHGSDTSTREFFLEEIDPELALISSAYDSHRERPHVPVLERLDDYNIDSLWTATHGSIVSESKGDGWEVYYQKEANMTPTDLRESSKVPIHPSSGYDFDNSLKY